MLQISKSNIFFIIICLINVLSVRALDILDKKEASNLEASFLILQSKDSIIDYNMNQIDSLFKEDNYTDLLRVALNLQNLIGNENSYSNYRLNYVIAQTYFKGKNIHLALKYYKKALNILNSNSVLEGNKNFNKDLDYVKSLNQIASSYLKISLIDTSRYIIDSAKYYFRKVEEFSSLDDNILDYKARSFSNLSGIYERDSVFYIAEIYARRALKIHKERNNTLSQASTLNNLGNIYLSQKKFEKSKEFYQEGLDIIKNYNSIEALDIKADIYYNLAWAMRNLKDYKAYDNLEKSFEFTERIRDDDFKKIVAQINAENNVDTARKEEVTKRLLREQKFWFSLGLSLIIIISLVFYALFYRQRRKTLALKLANIDYEQKQKLDALRAETHNRVLNATIDGKEEERKEIAAALHDHVSALLSSANLNLQVIKKQINGNAPEELEKTKNLLDEASDKVRDLSHSLFSPVLLKFGLKYSISDIAEKFSNSELTISTEVHNVKRYEKNFEVRTYNIIYEFCNNIIKHSKATQANIKVIAKENTLLLTISDNGVGFDKSIVNRKSGLGISQIEARIQVMKGNINIDSIKNKGTKIDIELPILETVS